MPQAKGKRKMDPYKRGLLKGPPECRKTEVVGKFVAVLNTRWEKRGLQLIAPYTRAVLTDEIHEFITTEERKVIPGDTVDSTATLGFVRIEEGGVVMVGDAVVIEGQGIGRIAGFDETHMPNHQNVVIRCKEKKTGFDLNVQPGQRVVIRKS